jgi:hypothetical protein
MPFYLNLKGQWREFRMDEQVRVSVLVWSVRSGDIWRGRVEELGDTLVLESVSLEFYPYRGHPEEVQEEDWSNSWAWKHLGNIFSFSFWVLGWTQGLHLEPLHQPFLRRIFKFVYSYVHILFGPFLSSTPPPPLSPPHPPPCFLAEPVLPLSLIFLKRKYKK